MVSGSLDNFHKAHVYHDVEKILVMPGPEDWWVRVGVTWSGRSRPHLPRLVTAKVAIIYEQLVVGFIPVSIIPLLGLIMVSIVAMTFLLVPWLNRFLDSCI
jgi:hypothetical protein